MYKKLNRKPNYKLQIHKSFIVVVVLDFLSGFQSLK